MSSCRAEIEPSTIEYSQNRSILVRQSLPEAPYLECSIFSVMILSCQKSTSVTWEYALVVAYNIHVYDLCPAALRLCGRQIRSIRRSVSNAAAVFCCLSSLRWFCRDWTTAVLLSLVSPGASWSDYSHCSMKQRSEIQLSYVRPYVFHQCCVNFTGCVSQNALNFVWLCISLRRQDSACVLTRDLQ